jgi:hypothetical protein
LNQLSACPKGNEPLALPCLACNHHVSVGVRTFLAARDTTSNIFADVSGSSRSV